VRPALDLPASLQAILLEAHLLACVVAVAAGPYAAVERPFQYGFCVNVAGPTR
jgi:hypothetical protein